VNSQRLADVCTLIGGALGALANIILLIHGACRYVLLNKFIM